MISHLLETRSPEYHLGLCQIGGFAFDEIRPLFKLDPTHIYLHCLTGGGINPAWLPELISPATARRKTRKSSLVPELKEMLLARLPAYMLPSSYHLLPSLPLNANGKLDRGNLPEPKFSDTRCNSYFVPPADDLERMLVTIIGDTLQLKRLGRTTNFIELGGNSLKIIQAHGRIQKELGREISIVEMFRTPTVQALAEYIRLGKESHPNHGRGRARTRGAKMRERNTRGRRGR